MGDERRLTRFTLADDEAVWIEIEEIAVDRAGEPGEGDISRTAKTQQDHEQRFREAVDKIRPAATAVFAAMRDLNTPRQIQLEFGIGFSGKVGAFIASADTSANFKVRLTWENEAATPSSAP
jgi:hypothetical protein